MGKDAGCLTGIDSFDSTRLRKVSDQHFATMTAEDYSPEDSQLVAELYKISKSKTKLIKSSSYPAPSDQTITVRSWKMNEFKYYDVPSPFPTLARGLFTVELPQTDEPRYRIVARGYDKFFNIDEIPWTSARKLNYNHLFSLLISFFSGPHWNLALVPRISLL